jgi:ketosteroid isomerase-like protein
MRRAALLLVLSGCSGAPPAGADAARGVTEAVMGMYGAFQKRELAKVGEFMTEDSTCYDATRSVLLVGRKAVLDHFGAILAEHKADQPWQSSIDGMDVVARGDLAYATYLVRTSMGGVHAQAAVTHVFRNVGGRWLAIHLHRSWNVQPR